MTTFRLPRAAYAAMAARAETDYPEETCGFAFGTGEALEVVPMRNVQNQLHAADPQRYPRDARTAYRFDDTELFRVLREKEDAGVPLAAIYHSHPNAAAYFSETDSSEAAPLGEPSYPGVVYLVFSVLRGKVADLKAFDWSGREGKYEEVPLEITGR
jgi:proteasome lid subunit RPN8/RPN11